MTTSSRPNLGGLFSGSTPPERSSPVAATLGTRLVTAPPVTESDDMTAAAQEAAEPEPAPGNPASSRGSGSIRERSAPVPPLRGPAGQSGVSVALEFIDPLRAVERYFAFLQVVLDVNRRVAIAVTSAAISLPRRAGIWR